MGADKNIFSGKSLDFVSSVFSGLRSIVSKIFSILTFGMLGRFLNKSPVPSENPLLHDQLATNKVPLQSEAVQSKQDQKFKNINDSDIPEFNKDLMTATDRKDLQKNLLAACTFSGNKQNRKDTRAITNIFLDKWLADSSSSLSATNLYHTLNDTWEKINNKKIYSNIDTDKEWYTKCQWCMHDMTGSFGPLSEVLNNFIETHTHQLPASEPNVLQSESSNLKEDNQESTLKPN